MNVELVSPAFANLLRIKVFIRHDLNKFIHVILSCFMTAVSPQIFKYFTAWHFDFRLQLSGCSYSLSVSTLSWSSLAGFMVNNPATGIELTLSSSLTNTKSRSWCLCPVRCFTHFSLVHSLLSPQNISNLSSCFTELFMMALPTLHSLVTCLRLITEPSSSVYSYDFKFHYLVIELPYDPAIPLLGMHTEESRIERDTCTPMFIAALFIIARPWKQPGCPSADEWIRKLWYIYTLEYYSAIKKNTFESVLMRWMKLEPITQSEVSQKEKHHYRILTHIYGI